MTKLIQLTKINSSSGVKELRNMYDQIELSVKNLKSLNICITRYGSLLVPLLNEQLPSELCVILSRKFENNIRRLGDMLKCSRNKRTR